jgi:L-cysteine desulfidase
MNKDIYKSYIDILNEELLPAMGCTEPIALAYASALAKKVLGVTPSSVIVEVSGNILKNVKSVIVPNTNGLKGVSAAAAAGIVLGNPDTKLQVLSEINNSEVYKISEFLSSTPITIKKANSKSIFYIKVTLFYDNDSASVEIEGRHTNVVCITKNGENLPFEKIEEVSDTHTDRSVLSIKDIIEFCDMLNIDDVRDIFSRQIEYNTAICNEGLKSYYGARVGKVLLSAFGDTVFNKAKATASAGSDARMNGCSMPVVIVSGSGNQGITASVPVVVYGENLGFGKDDIIRAVTLSDLVTIHLKTGIGRLSAYCGAVSAGAGAGAGIAYLQGGKFEAVAHTIVNALAIDSGLICDGAKSSCAAKIATAIESGLLGYEMYKRGSEFFGGDGILERGVENTIDNVGSLARIGMRETDEEIIRLMLKNLDK